MPVVTVNRKLRSLSVKHCRIEPFSEDLSCLFAGARRLSSTLELVLLLYIGLELVLLLEMGLGLTHGL